MYAQNHSETKQRHKTIVQTLLFHRDESGTILLCKSAVGWDRSRALILNMVDTPVWTPRKNE